LVLPEGLVDPVELALEEIRPLRRDHDRWSQGTGGVERGAVGHDRQALVGNQLMSPAKVRRLHSYSSPGAGVRQAWMRPSSTWVAGVSATTARQTSAMPPARIGAANGVNGRSRLSRG